MGGGVDRVALEASLMRLDQLTVHDVDTGVLLGEVVEAARRLLQVSGSGLMVVDAAHVLRYVAASDEGGRALEDAQEAVGEGPCMTALVLDAPVASVDLTQDERWPRLRPLLKATTVRAVLSVPVRLGGGPVGTLNVHLDRPHDWETAVTDALTSYAGVLENLLAASVAVHRSGELARQLQYALDYRMSIERAIGFVMASEQVDPVTAFNLLRTRARSSRRKIGEVAQETVRGTAGQ
jgi:GAF domain-containing protein